MSLARAFTRRNRRPEITLVSAPPTRAASIRQPGAALIDRKLISSPVALLSTTNMLSYDAPDIFPKRQASLSSSASSTASSSNAADDSDASLTSNRSTETLTDASSVDSVPSSPEPNHLSCYFHAAQGKQGLRRSVSSSQLQHGFQETASAPVIPKRALSHSKKAHERLARKRSLQHMSQSSLRTSGSVRGSGNSYKGLGQRDTSSERPMSPDLFSCSAVDLAHPFGKELEQLNEIVEELVDTVRDAEMDEDLKAIQQKGLTKFCADDYMMEINPFYSEVFSTPMVAVVGVDCEWI